MCGWGGGREREVALCITFLIFGAYCTVQYHVFDFCSHSRPVEDVPCSVFAFFYAEMRTVDVFLASQDVWTWGGDDYFFSFE